MQLPDESIAYNYQGLMQGTTEEWDAAAELRACHLLAPARFKDLQQRLLQCRSQIAADRELLNPPPEALPLEPGFINLPQEMLDNYRRKQDHSEVGRIQVLAKRLRDDFDRVVFLAAGGAHLGPVALFQALKSSYHNELPADTRLGAPRVYFEGHSADNDSLQELLELLQIQCVEPEKREERWAVVVLSKSGAALEPLLAHRAFRREATEYFGLRSPWTNRAFAAVTAASSPLRNLCKAYNLDDSSVLTVPDNVGERFSVLSALGLLPAAVLDLDIRALLLGAQAMTRRFLEEPIERNPVLQFAGLNYLMSVEMGKPVRALAAWSHKLAGVTAWYEHLVSETLGKQGRGPTAVSLVQTRDLHARGQFLQHGTRGWVVNNLVVNQPHKVPITIQMADRNEDDLNQFNRRSMPDVTRAAHTGATQAAWEVARPTADIVLPALSEHTMGQLLQMLMLATVVEARLMGLNPYSAPGLDAARGLMYQALRKPPEPLNEKPGRPGSDPGR